MAASAYRRRPRFDEPRVHGRSFPWAPSWSRLWQRLRILHLRPQSDSQCRTRVPGQRPGNVWGHRQALYRSYRRSGRGRSWRELTRSAHLDRTLNRKHVAPLVTACCAWPRGGTNESAANGDVLPLMRHDLARRIKQDRRMESHPVSSRPQIVDHTIRRARSRTSECRMEWCGGYGLHCTLSRLPPIAR